MVRLFRIDRVQRVVGLLGVGLGLFVCAGTAAAAQPLEQASNVATIAPYQPRPGHSRAVVAVVGENAGVELSDFLVPFAILSRAGGIDVRAVSTGPGPMATFTDMGLPGIRIATDTSLADFDAAYPDGADYVVVPAQAGSARLLAWLSQQSARGATLVSICNGATVVAQTGRFGGRRATAHWSTESSRARAFPDIRWTPDRRYMADGNWISTAGVSAAIPASVALVEAIGGRTRAAATARAIGLSDWSPTHISGAFHPRLGSTAWPLAKVLYANRWLHARDAIAVIADEGVDEMALALTVDAYSSTGRSHAVLMMESGAALTTLHGLRILAEQRTAATHRTIRVAADDDAPAAALDRALGGIMQRYGQATARGVALAFEYPGVIH